MAAARWGSDAASFRSLAGGSEPAHHPPGAHRRRDAPLGGAAVAPRRARTVHERMQATPEFVELRRRQRRFVFPMTAAFLLWYLTYILLASYARDLMAIPVADGVNLGLVIGLLQFVSTFAISTAYVVFARLRLDPLAEKLRERIEGADADGDGDGDGAATTTAHHMFDDGADGLR